MAHDPILTSPHEATSEWLTSVLAADVRVVAIEQFPDAGIVSPVARVRLTGDGPPTVVVKCAPEDDAWRARVNYVGLLKTEAFFYRDIGEKCGIPVPHCWHAAWREADGHCTIVMEDLDPLVPADNFAGLTYDQAEIGVELLATMHSRHWQAVDQWEWLTERAQAQQRSAEATGALVPDVLARYGDRFPETIRSLLPEISDRIPDVRAAAPIAAHTTLVHGDFHAANIAFGERRDDVKVFDWQLAMAATPASDLIKLLLNGLTVPARREDGRWLLQQYRDAMGAQGVSISEDDLAALIRAEILTRIGSSTRVASSAAPGSFTEAWAILCMDRMGTALDDGW